MHLQGQAGEAEIYLVAHAGKADASFKLPPSDHNSPWRLFVDTALPAEQASAVPGEEQALENQGIYTVRKNSVVVLLR